MQWLKILFSVCIVFVFSVIGVMLIKKCSIKNATIVCREFVKEIMEALFAPTPQPKQYYPTIAGWDGWHIVPTFVDADFIKVRENFAACFCTGAEITDNGNFVMYRFDIQRKVNTLDDSILTTLIQKQTEEICANTMRLYDCYLPPEPLTLVELFPHMLCVAFARTDDGIKIMDAKKRNMQKRKLMSNSARHDSMTENWEQK